jgi:hypothetical protein
MLSSLALYPFTAIKGSVKGMLDNSYRVLTAANSMPRAEFYQLIAEAQSEAANTSLKVSSAAQNPTQHDLSLVDDA